MKRDIDTQLRKTIETMVRECDTRGYSALILLSSDSHTEYRMTFSLQTGLIDEGDGRFRLRIKEGDFPTREAAHSALEQTAGLLVHWRNIVRPLAGLFTQLMKKIHEHVDVIEDDMSGFVPPEGRP